MHLYKYMFLYFFCCLILTVLYLFILFPILNSVPYALLCGVAAAR